MEPQTKSGRKTDPQKRRDRLERRQMMVLNAILSTIQEVIFNSENVDFQTKCFAELGTSVPEEIHQILWEKLSSSLF